MQIFVKSLSGETLTLEVEPSSTVYDLVNHLTTLDRTFLEDGRIIFRGSILEEDSCLLDCDLEEGSTLNFVVGLPGGAKKRKKKNYTTPKKNKHKKKKVKLAVLRYYKVDDNGKITRLRKECNDCGAGVFMANHADRHYCGNCTTTIVFNEPEQ